MLFQNTLITTLQYEIYSCNPLPYGSSSIQHLNSHLHFLMLLKIFEVLITNFMNPSNHIFCAHEIIQYCHLDIRPDLVLNIHGTVIYMWILWICGDHSGTVVKVLYYKLEDRQLDPRWCHGIFPRWCHGIFHWSNPSKHHGPGVDSASNINEYQDNLLGVYAVGA